MTGSAEQVPGPGLFYAAELDRSQVVAAERPDHQGLVELSDWLASPWLQEEIAAGNVTLAMIKPQLDEAIDPRSPLFGEGDTDTANGLEAEIQELGVMAKFSVVFDGEAVGAFYTGKPREHQLAEAPALEYPEGTPPPANRWEEFVTLMTNGPVTVLLLRRPDGTAIETWRQQIGHWNIQTHRDDDTIRARHGLDNNHNNLVHGSDSAEAVERELSIINLRLQRYLHPLFRTLGETGIMRLLLKTS